MTLIVLRTTSDYYHASDLIDCQYYLEYTGAELAQVALMNLNLAYDPRYRCCLRGFDGKERWLRSAQRLVDQGVENRMMIIVMIPGEVASQPTYVAHDDTVYLPIRNTFIQNTRKPFTQSGNPDISGYLVDFKDYEKIAKLGSGAFGTVFKARCKKTGQIVAVKELQCDVHDAKQKELFNREVQILGTAHHPALLSLHGCTEFVENLEHGPLIMTPFCPCGSVQDAIDNERNGLCDPKWTPTQKHIVLYGVASGMAFMHESRLIHRDLKPANVLLDENMEPKIADFGLSKFVQKGQTVFHTIRGGTPAFMAPEIYEDDYNFKVDVYAFAMIMYVVLSGLEPYKDCKNQMVLARKVLAGERPPIPGHVAAPYRELIERCWDTSPEMRPDFSEIVMCLGQEAMLDSVDIDAFRDYQEKVAPVEMIPPITQAFAEQNRMKMSTMVFDKVDPAESLKQMADRGDSSAQAKYGGMLESGQGVAQNLSEAVEYYRRSAVQGNKEGMVYYGRCLRYGKGCSQNIPEALSYFQKAVDQGDLDGMDELAKMYRYGIGVYRTEGKAAQLWKQAADAGHYLAQSYYGEMLEEGRGVKRDIAEAVKYYKMASDHACPHGMFNYADMLQHGKNVPADPEEAVRLYKLAADEGDNESLFALCEIYLHGEGPVRPNSELAAICAEEGAKRKSFRSMLQWAEILEKGIGVRPDPVQARKILEEAHSEAFRSEQNNYAYVLEHGKGCTRNPELAVKYYRIAAQNGSQTAMCNLGNCYESGDGVPRDLVQAASWIKKAADAGLDVGLHKYGRCLRSGMGVEVNYAEARRYFQLAITKHYGPSFRELGLMMEKGQGGPKDPAAAVDLYRKAAEMLDATGCAYLADMYENGNGVPQNLPEAARWYIRGVELGSGMAMLRLGTMYKEGRGVPPDRSQARRLYEMAANCGFPGAADLLRDL